MSKTRLRTVKILGRWWIEGPWDEPCGPYKSKAEADEDRHGLLRTLRHKDEPGYVTGDSAVSEVEELH